MLQAHDITIRKGGKELLGGVTVAVQPGSVVAVVGPNGAGKSTLLRALCGELPPDSGSITLNGKPLGGTPARAQAQQRGVMPQDSSLSFPFSGLEVALLGRTPHTGGKRETPNDYAVAHAALRATGAEQLATQRYPTMSGGERQRVQLARVLAQIWEQQAGAARYLLLDEPVSSLDVAHQHNTLRIARQFSRNGVGVLAVLHDLNLAAQYADSIVVMKEGRVMQHGPPFRVLRPETIQEAFGLPAYVQRHPELECPLVIICGHHAAGAPGCTEYEPTDATDVAQVTDTAYKNNRYHTHYQ